MVNGTQEDRCSVACRGRLSVSWSKRQTGNVIYHADDLVWLSQIAILEGERAIDCHHPATGHNSRQTEQQTLYLFWIPSWR